MAMPSFEGDGGACAMNAHETVAAKIKLNVGWGLTLANAGCDSKSMPPCSGEIDIWLLSKYDINGTSVTGTTFTCGNKTPPIPLSPAGSQSEGLPSGQQGTVQIAFDPSVWANIMANPNKAPTPVQGTIGGWNIGSTFTIEPTNSVYGLSATSTFSSSTTTWPPTQASLMASDLADDDNDGHPGITATPSNAMGFSLPSTAPAMAPPYPPQADQLYVALRTELSLYGTSSSCTDVSGTVDVQLLNNHVIGCRIAGDGGACSMDQYNFIDENTTVYVGPNVTIPRSVMPPSFAPPGITGTFQAKVLSTDADAGGIDCNAVLTALP
jgi:hypothetical protein